MHSSGKRTVPLPPLFPGYQCAISAGRAMVEAAALLRHQDLFLLVTISATSRKISSAVSNSRFAIPTRMLFGACPAMAA